MVEQPGICTFAAVPRHTEINNITANKICKELEIPRL